MFEIYLDDLTEQAKERLAKEINLNDINEDMPIAILENDRGDHNRVKSIEIDAELFCDEISFDHTSWAFDYDSLVDNEKVFDYLVKYESNAVKDLQDGRLDYIEVYRDVF